MYVSPKVTTYGSEELVELLGPAETQYVTCDCDAPSFVNVVPDTFLTGKDDVRLEVDVSGCLDFNSVQLRLIDMSGRVLINSTFQRSQGGLNGGTWVLDPWEFGFAPPEDMYRVEVVLIESLTCRSQSAFGSFVIE